MTRAAYIKATITAGALSGTLMFGAAYATDKVELFDSGSFRIVERPLEVFNPQLDPLPAIGPSEIDLNPPTSSEGAGVITLTTTTRTDNGVRLGMEIRLDDSDQVELKDSDRLFLESDFGRIGRAGNLMIAGPDLGWNSGIMNARGFDSVALLSRAVSLGLDARTFSLLSLDPGAVSPGYAGVRIGFTNADRLAADPSERGFNVAITSMVMANQPSASDLNFLDNAAFGSFDQSYNIGLNVGYRGFTFAASFLRGSQAFNDYESYDFGLSYDFGSWATTLAVGGYFADRSQSVGLLNGFDVDRLYSIEIGASYQIRPWFTVSGSLRLFDYSTLLGTELDGLGGSLFLGTGLSF